MDNRIYTVADYEIYKRKAKELRRRERENAKTCGMLRCLAHDFGRMYCIIKLIGAVVGLVGWRRK